MSDDAATTDSLLGGRVRIRQPRHGFRAAIDPVLLAAAVEARPGERALELGCGTGAALLCLAVRCSATSILGIDSDVDLVALARASVALNELEHRATVEAGDVTALPGAASPASFDHVLMNPPFHDRARSRSAAGAAREKAMGESAAAPLARWVDAAADALRRGGKLTLIWRADRLETAIAAIGGRLGSIAVLPLWPKAGAAAVRIIVQARKGGRTPTRLLPGLVLHGADGRFTTHADSVLREAAALSWADGEPILPSRAA
ncbi:MAG: methyltransferase [Alphaproteobacteria bacterium]|nr:methyltransferase [Alphaproteobacteria bacterium]